MVVVFQLFVKGITAQIHSVLVAIQQEIKEETHGDHIGLCPGCDSTQSVTKPTE